MRLRSAAVAALLSVAVTAAPAHALEVDPEAPVVVDDSITLWPGEARDVNVLANDTDPGGAALDVCRLPGLSVGGPAQPVTVWDASMFGLPDGDLAVQASERARGTHVIDYYVCNLTRLTPAHLTVKVRPVEPVEVVPGPVDHVLVTNHNAKPIRFVVLPRRGCRPQFHGRVPEGGTRQVRVQEHKVAWIARIGTGGIADQGRVHGVSLSKPPAPVGHDGADACAWLTIHSSSTDVAVGG